MMFRLCGTLRHVQGSYVSFLMHRSFRSLGGDNSQLTIKVNPSIPSRRCKERDGLLTMTSLTYPIEQWF
jgi:hypothetical protein